MGCFRKGLILKPAQYEFELRSSLVPASRLPSPLKITKRTEIPPSPQISKDFNPSYPKATSIPFTLLLHSE
jgi:hypothetical protein